MHIVPEPYLAPSSPTTVDRTLPVSRPYINIHLKKQRVTQWVSSGWSTFMYRVEVFVSLSSDVSMDSFITWPHRFYSSSSFFEAGSTCIARDGTLLPGPVKTSSVFGSQVPVPSSKPRQVPPPSPFLRHLFLCPLGPKISSGLDSCFSHAHASLTQRNSLEMVSGCPNLQTKSRPPWTLFPMVLLVTE